jgi:hypothetical protein
MFNTRLFFSYAIIGLCLAISFVTDILCDVVEFLDDVQDGARAQLSEMGWEIIEAEDF